MRTPRPLGRTAPDPSQLGGRGRRALVVTVGLSVALVVTAAVCVGLGPVPVPLGDTVRVLAAATGLGGSTGADPAGTVPADIDPATTAIVLTVRVPRVLLGAAVGACLAVSGVALQALVRNVLADPYVLGISGGASTGAASAILFGAGAGLGASAQPVLAFVGALTAALLVLGVARSHGTVTSVRLLLAGVAVGYALSATTSLLIFSSDSAEGTRSVLFWMLGSLSLARWDAVLLVTGVAAVAGTAVLCSRAHVLDALLTGDGTAHALGLSPSRARIGILVVVSLCTAAAVSAAGAIGFVGLVVPHLARRLVGPRHLPLLPVAALLGAVFLLAADVLARMALPPRELPIGVITAAVGAPFLLILVRRLSARTD